MEQGKPAEREPMGGGLGVGSPGFHDQPPGRCVRAERSPQRDRQQSGLACPLDAGGVRRLVVEAQLGHLVSIVEADLQAARHPANAPDLPQRSGQHLLRVDVDRDLPLRRQQRRSLAARIRVVGPAHLDPGPDRERGRQLHPLAIPAFDRGKDFIRTDDDVGLMAGERNVQRGRGGFGDRQREDLTRGLRRHLGPEFDLDTMTAPGASTRLPTGTGRSSARSRPGPPRAHPASFWSSSRIGTQVASSDGVTMASSTTRFAESSSIRPRTRTDCTKPGVDAGRTPGALPPTPCAAGATRLSSRSGWAILFRSESRSAGPGRMI